MKNQSKLVEAVYPAEFLDCFTETAFKTLYDYMEQAGARQEAIELLDSMHLLTKEMQTLQAEKVDRAVNQTLIENVADASRCIVALGGVFYAPSGSSVPRADQLQADQLQDQAPVLQADQMRKPPSIPCRARNRAAVAAPVGLQ